MSTTNAALAAAEAAYNAARNAAAIADAEAAEAARLADPLEQTRDAAAQAVADARANMTAALKLATGSKTHLDAAEATRTAMIAAAMAGTLPDDKQIATAATAVQVSATRYSFYLDVQNAAQTAITAAVYAQEQANGHYMRAMADRRDRAILAEFRSFFPAQADDDVLRAEIARNPGIVDADHTEASRLYDLAYNHQSGPAFGPAGTPRQRLITEGQDYSRARLWAQTINPEVFDGANRSAVKQLRISRAAQAHFAKYTALGFDQLVALQHLDYQAVRQRLPVWSVTGTIRPGTYAAL